MRSARFLYGALLASVIAGTVGLAAQAPAAKPSTPGKTAQALPRTAWGDPDLQGIWRNQEQGVPFERPKELGTKEFWTDEEIAAKVKAEEARRAKLRAGENLPPPPNRLARAFPDYGYRPPPPVPTGAIRIPRRTSAIIDPPNGRLPAWTPAAIARYKAREQARWDRGENDSWLDRGWSERCLKLVAQAFVAPLNFIDANGNHTIFFGVGGYTPETRIVQMPGYIALVREEDPNGGHGIIPLGGSPAPSLKLRQGQGVQRGRWEGNTLVVETTNVNDQQDGGAILWSHETGQHPGSGETLRVIERFTLRDANTLEYRFTVEDPVVYTRPFTAVMELRRDDGYDVVPEQCQENQEGFQLGMLKAGQMDKLGTLEFAREAAQRRLQMLKEREAEWAQSR